MIDIKILRENPELVRANGARRGCTVDITALYEKDQECLRLIREVEDLRAERNRLSSQCRDNPSARDRVRDLKQVLAEKEQRQEQLRQAVDEQLAWLPNFLAEDVPDGGSDADNQAVRFVGEKPAFDFEPLDHQALGERLGIIDTARGAKVAQAGFYYWVGQGALLAQAMFFWAQRELQSRGFSVFMSPCVAKARTLFGTGYLPFFADQTYQLSNEDLALIGTSEQTLVGYHADETLDAASLPRCYTAFTPCFRTEAGSYGKQARGIFRVHQFHKVEQIVFCLPEESPRCHERCQENEEYLLQQLGIPYRVVKVCVGDMGAPGYKKYDIEAWFAGYGGYREVTSNTNLTDFQSRRLGIRFKDADGRKGFVHTISATGVTDRVVCAILETHQQADGSVVVPAPLRAYTGFDRIVPPGA
ncbi:MAG: serine--tRNA ligase [Lentisphaerae bacterium]|nr:serine--tRNA ligase [Lentisphaerota bacterium]